MKTNNKNLIVSPYRESIVEDNHHPQNHNPVQETRKELHNQSRTRRRFWIIAAAIIIMLAVAGVSLASCSKSKHIAPLPHKESEFRYAMLEASWNQFVDKYPEKFKMFGERGGSDVNLVKTLNQWLSAFSSHPDSNYVAELAKLKNVYGVTTFHAWEDFRREHHRQNELVLNPQMTPAAVCEAINNYIGLAKSQNPQDYISVETVKTIVYMNSICAFFDGEKDDLHKDGIDSEIYECSKLDPGAKFPLLQKSLNY